ncbi:MAG TPA: hypothetical protein VF525_11130 [Pyrinomonadaceae bacterium]|jgi:hypothetical protein
MDNRKCPNCHLVNWADAPQCARCGYPLTEAGATTAAYTASDLAVQQTGARQRADTAGNFAPGAAADSAPLVGTAFADQIYTHENEFGPRVAPFTSVGTGLNQAWAIYTQNFTLIAKLVLFAAIPFALGQAALTYRMQSSIQNPLIAIALNALIFMLVRWSLIPSAVIYAVTRKWTTGVAPGISASYQWAAGRWLRVLSVLLVSGLITLLGMLLIVPGLILSVMYSLVLPVALFEPALGVDRVLGRSAELTKGVRWPIFGAIVLISIFASIGGGVVSAVFVGAAFMLGQGALVLANALNLVVSEVLSQLAVVLALTIYLGRLAATEQTDASYALAGTQAHANAPQQ